MTKMIKMSLIAATAVVGMSSTASAQNLEDAIKGVEVSGYVDYRNEVQSGDQTGTDVNEYAVNVTLTSKVNDMVKATVSAGFDEVVSSNKTAADTSAPVGVDQAYFTFDTGFATVMAGKQNIPSVFVDQADTVAKGTGLVALKPVNDALTVAVAHFMQTNLKVGGTPNGASVDTLYDVKTTELVALGKVSMVNYEAHYNMTSLDNTELKGMFLNVGADLGVAKVMGQTASMDSDATGTKTGKVTILGVSGKAGSIALDAKYFMGKDNNSVDVSLNGDNDSKAHAKVWQASTAGSTDMTGFVVTAGTKIGDVDAKLVYAAASDDTSATSTTDYTELMPMVTYKMSKNFMLHARYSMLTKSVTGTADKDLNKSRLEVKYTF